MSHAFDRAPAAQLQSQVFERLPGLLKRRTIPDHPSQFVRCRNHRRVDPQLQSAATRFFEMFASGRFVAKCLLGISQKTMQCRNRIGFLPHPVRVSKVPERSRHH